MHKKSIHYKRNFKRYAPAVNIKLWLFPSFVCDFEFIGILHKTRIYDAVPCVDI